ncbi:non-hemolytic phospholipase C precursor [Mytilinidion resinicola]|uniref:Non-hemolytic phospholipase C n=1 Tax=Mytilinidion resinicola TaxID=574789 RepID=A0A6A6Y6V1_9PEZI|nr:non-hemolytic phospholipase C precursor [Mytilinidion resinicola]KAF2804329.1 non-hemolytic phospholipase C precursor [Mytilinidion resinicola]
MLPQVSNTPPPAFNVGHPSIPLTGSLKDVNHVVLFMQENRAFDHYFGSMAGIRGYSDPNVQVNAGRPVWYQDVDSSLSDNTDHLLPWYLNHLGGSWPEASQCMVAGENGWHENQGALNGGLNNLWALNNTPWSWGHFRRDEIPVHFGIAEGWTVADMYQESVIAMTNPNRVAWVSGSINAPGSPQTPDQGGPTIDNNETPGCEGDHLNCYPLKWKTAPEYYQDAGVSWQVYQDRNNFDDNPFAWFWQYQTALPWQPLSTRGVSFLHSLDAFYVSAAAGTLPQVSYIIGPEQLSEHPPYQPKDGAWLQKKVVDAVTKGASYNDTVLIISYDETGGWGDHVTPYHSPENTQGEWMKDPYGNLGDVYTGPGFRVPFYIVSPWTRGGHVFTEHADHISQIKFVEQWLETKGFNVTSDQVPHWRREHMSDLLNAFDFLHPDFSLPEIPEADAPSKDFWGRYDGYAKCEAKFPENRPPVPYGQQTEKESLVSEEGFKKVRGQLTEGRYLVFEAFGWAVTNKDGRVGVSRASAKHEKKAQRWVVHQDAPASDVFTVSSAVDGLFIGKGLRLVKGVAEAQKLRFTDLGNGLGYAIRTGDGRSISLTKDGRIGFEGKGGFGFELFSVTYRD